jgi:hypothetical protein
VIPGIQPTLCSQPELLGPGLGDARCIDAARLPDVARRPANFGRGAARTSGSRPGCRCAPSRDSPGGCVYCYAVADRDRAVANFRGHDPEAAMLRG